jgi:Protein of unknown function (DUF3606)
LFQDGQNQQVWHESFYMRIKSCYMQKNTLRGRAQDRKKVAGGQDHEVQYEKDKMNVSGKEVKAAVKTEGNSRKKVEKKLGK